MRGRASHHCHFKSKSRICLLLPPQNSSCQLELNKHNTNSKPYSTVSRSGLFFCCESCFNKKIGMLIQVFRSLLVKGLWAVLSWPLERRREKSKQATWLLQRRSQLCWNVWVCQLSDCTACLCKSQQKQSQGNSTAFHSVVLLPDNHQEEAQSNGEENETTGSSQEQANSEIQK